MLRNRADNRNDRHRELSEWDRGTRGLQIPSPILQPTPGSQRSAGWGNAQCPSGGSFPGPKAALQEMGGVAQERRRNPQQEPPIRGLQVRLDPAGSQAVHQQSTYWTSLISTVDPN